MPRHVHSSGSLIARSTDSGVAVFSGDDLRAGSVRSARVTIVNAGALPGRFALVELGAANSFAAGDLAMVIDDVSGKRPVVAYRGDIGGVPPGGIDLGEFEPGEERSYRFLLALALDSPNGGQGRSAGAFYRWGFVAAGDQARGGGR
jgi:hypothetical protein